MGEWSIPYAGAEVLERAADRHAKSGWSTDGGSGAVGDDRDYPWATTVTLPPAPTSPGAARSLLRQFLEQCDVPEPDSAELLLTEVVTNAVVHARTEMTVRLLAGPERFRAEVQDCSRQPPQPRRVTSRSENGRGLLLLDRLAEDWGCALPQDQAAGECKTVWFELAPKSGGTGHRGQTEERDPFAAFDFDAVEAL
jgi:hypothetical protein